MAGGRVVGGESPCGVFDTDRFCCRGVRPPAVAKPEAAVRPEAVAKPEAAVRPDTGSPSG
jgi:hypothetical protein